jgi:cytochrome c oxidase assembly protein subunit 15
MPTAAVPAATQQLLSPALRRFAWGVLVYFIATILWGTLVRATGSGDGCGNHWPLCNGTVMQVDPGVKTIIEFTHRLTTGLSGFVVLGLLIWTYAGTVRGHLARAAAIASVVLTVVEGILGALLVKLGLTAQSQSPLRPAYLALHLTNTLLLLAAITLTAHFLGRATGYLRSNIRLRAPFGAVATVVVVMVVGVTGSLAALGDTLFPASSLSLAMAQDFSSASTWLVRWRWMHPAAAFLSSIVLIWLLRPWDRLTLSLCPDPRPYTQSPTPSPARPSRCSCFLPHSPQAAATPASASGSRSPHRAESPYPPPCRRECSGSTQRPGCSPQPPRPGVATHSRSP